MSRLHDEIDRLYRLPGGALTDGAGQARTLVLGLRAPADWAALATVWRAVQEDWGWPAPAIAVDGQQVLALWFSLATPRPLADLQALAEALTRQHLGGVPPRLRMAWPGADTPAPALPGEATGDERWSAFVAPDLAPLFAETPWLDLPPSAEGQAALLAGLRSVPDAAVAAALQAATAPAEPAPEVPAPSASAPLDLPAQDDPADFLRAVMRDPRAPLALRVDAAKALLAAGR